MTPGLSRNYEIVIWVMARERRRPEQRDAGAMTNGTVDFHPPGVAVDDAFDHGQAKPKVLGGVSARLIDTVEPVKDARQMRGRNTAASISDADHQFIAVSAGNDLYLATRQGMGNGIANDI